jgi:hypothetical protein
MFDAGHTQDRPYHPAWRRADDGHETRDRAAILAVLAGGILAGLIVAWNLTAGPSISGQFDPTRLQGSEQASRKLSGYQPCAAGASACAPDKLVNSAAEPPRDAAPVAQGPVRPELAPQDAPARDSATVAGTDGTGVVLRASPRDDDWTPRGFMDGAQVTVLERVDADWARVRGENGQEGWVPARYIKP